MAVRIVGKYIVGVARLFPRSRHTSQLKKDITMNKDQVEGRIDQLKGKVIEATGKVTGDKKLEAEGKADQLTGEVKANYGDAKEALKDKAKDIVDKL
jgi:uncharacterized protein YjbJ (UPF0337 family)